MNNIIVFGGLIVIIAYVIFAIIWNKKRFETEESNLFNFNGINTKNLEKKLTELGTIAAKAKNNILNNNEEILKNSANKEAEIKKNAIKTVALSIKEGLTEEGTIYCKHCGASIDADSKFCKSCGKEQ